MAQHGTRFIDIALRPGVVIPAIRLSLFVGTVLALINHGGEILRMELSPADLLQIALTYLVPYSVSTYSAVRALQRYERNNP